MSFIHNKTTKADDEANLPERRSVRDITKTAKRLELEVKQAMSDLKAKKTKNKIIPKKSNKNKRDDSEKPEPSSVTSLSSDQNDKTEDELLSYDDDKTEDESLSELEVEQESVILDDLELDSYTSDYDTEDTQSKEIDLDIEHEMGKLNFKNGACGYDHDNNNNEAELSLNDVLNTTITPQTVQQQALEDASQTHRKMLALEVEQDITSAIHKDITIPMDTQNASGEVTNNLININNDTSIKDLKKTKRELSVVKSKLKQKEGIIHNLERKYNDLIINLSEIEKINSQLLLQKNQAESKEQALAIELNFANQREENLQQKISVKDQEILTYKNQVWDFLQKNTQKPDDKDLVAQRTIPKKNLLVIIDSNGKKFKDFIHYEGNVVPEVLYTHRQLEEKLLDPLFLAKIEKSNDILITTGTNDIRPKLPEETREPITAIQALINIKRILGKIREKTKAKIHVMELPPLITEDLNFALMIPSYNTNLSTIAEKEGAEIIKQKRTDPKDMAPDGYHITKNLAIEIGSVISQFFRTNKRNDEKNTIKLGETKEITIMHESSYKHLVENRGQKIKELTSNRGLKLELYHDKITKVCKATIHGHGVDQREAQRLKQQLCEISEMCRQKSEREYSRNKEEQSRHTKDVRYTKQRKRSESRGEHQEKRRKLSSNNNDEHRRLGRR